MMVVERWQDIPVIPVYYEKSMKVVERWQDIPVYLCVLWEGYDGSGALTGYPYVMPLYYEKVIKVVELWQDISCNTCVL